MSCLTKINIYKHPFLYFFMETKRADTVISFREGNISLVLNSYNDLFSDFDPRSYDERALSDDFLYECKKAARDKENKVELRFLLPKSKRNSRDEVKIKQRLKSHFHRHYKSLEKEIRTIKLKGFMWFILGAIIMVFGTFLYNLRGENYFYTFLFILTEPAGWYFFWEGLNKVFLESHSKKPDFLFYKKMAFVNISFLDY